MGNTGTPTIALKCMNGFTLHIKGANLIVKANRKEDTYPISKIQSFSLKEPRAITPGAITFRTAQAAAPCQFRPHVSAAALGAEQNFFLYEVRIKHSNPGPRLYFKLRRRKGHSARGQGCFCR